MINAGSDPDYTRPVALLAQDGDVRLPPIEPIDLVLDAGTLNRANVYLSCIYRARALRRQLSSVLHRTNCSPNPGP
jgi:hypothetical protein